MGDRGNIAIRESAGKEVNFYTHDLGSTVPHIVRKALARKERWGDSACLARLVFCELVKGREQGTTGFGISTERGDYNHPDVVIDTQEGTVSYRSPLTEVELRKGHFADFIALTQEQLAEDYKLDW